MKELKWTNIGIEVEACYAINPVYGLHRTPLDRDLYLCEDDETEGYLYAVVFADDGVRAYAGEFMRIDDAMNQIHDLMNPASGRLFFIDRGTNRGVYSEDEIWDLHGLRRTEVRDTTEQMALDLAFDGESAWEIVDGELEPVRAKEQAHGDIAEAIEDDGCEVVEAQ